MDVIFVMKAVLLKAGYGSSSWMTLLPRGKRAPAFYFKQLSLQPEILLPYRGTFIRSSGCSVHLNT